MKLKNKISFDYKKMINLVKNPVFYSYYLIYLKNFLKKKKHNLSLTYLNSAILNLLRNMDRLLRNTVAVGKKNQILSNSTI